MPTGTRILVVDDSDLVREIFVRHLATAGFDVVAVSNGAEGLRVLRDDPSIGLVLLDFRMPGMNGMEFRQQQLADPSIAGVPVVIITGSPLDDEERKRLRGIEPLQKPIQRDELLRIVNRYCSPEG